MSTRIKNTNKEINKLKKDKKSNESATIMDTFSYTTRNISKRVNVFETILKNNQNVNDTTVKGLLQKKQLTSLQVGRIIFLNACLMFEGHKQLFTNEEYSQMVAKIKPEEDEIGKFVTYQRLTTYAINAQNYLKARSESSLIGLQYIQLQARLIRDHHQSSLIDSDQISYIIEEVKGTLKFIDAYAIFHDAMRVILKNDRRIKPSYRITSQAQKVINEVKIYNGYILKLFSKDVRKKYNLQIIDEISKNYSEKTKAKELSDYLIDKFSYTNFVDNIVTMETTLYISSYFSDNC